MASKRISDLPAETDPAATDVIAIDGATTRKATRANLLKENLEAIRGLTSAADKGIQFTGAGTAATYDLTAAGKALLDDADAAAQRTTLGLEIGTDVQAQNAGLSDIAGITFAQGDILYHNGTNLAKLAAGTSGNFLKTQGAGANPTWAALTGGGDLLSTNNLSDLADAETARFNLGLPDFSYIVTGIDNTGSTDVGAALNAFIQGTPAYSTVVLPFGIYHTSVEIVVNAGRTLLGCGGGFGAGVTTAATCIRGALALASVVLLDGEAGSLSSNLKGIQITREAGAVPASSVGLSVYRINNGIIEDVVCSRHAIGVSLVDDNVSVRFNRIQTYTISLHHFQMKASAIEITVAFSRFGINGSQDVNCTSFVHMYGGEWDTIRFHCCQWNQGTNTATQAILFDSYDGTNVNGIFIVSMLHCEGASVAFMTGIGVTTRIPRVTISDSQINNPGLPFIQTANLLDRLVLNGTRIAMTVLLDQVTNSTVSGCVLTETFAISASYGAVVTGNRIYGNVTLSGACTKSVFAVNSVEGSTTNTATGITVANNA